MNRNTACADRGFQMLLGGSTVGLSWLLMMVVHECGHMLHGWLSGAELVNVELPPLGFSRTDFAKNPHPLFVAWGGGIWGILLSLAILVIVQFTVPRHAYLARWFVGFCMIANGAYLACGSLFDLRADDAGVILQSGGSRWLLLAFGIPTVAAGLYLWNGLGLHFGLGAADGKVDRKAAIIMAFALALLVCVEMLIQRY